MAFEQPCIVLEADDPMTNSEAFVLADLKFTSLRSNRDNAMRKHIQGLCKAAWPKGSVPKCLTLSPADSYE